MSAPLRILTISLYADDLGKAMTIPHTITHVPGLTDETVLPLLDQIDALVATSFKASWAPHAGSLRIIQGTGAGTEGFDFAAVPPGVQVCNVYGHEYAIAEYTFMVMAALNRGLLNQERAFRLGNWGDRQPRRELRDRSLLVIGVGHIGAEVARWGQFMGMKVSAITRTPSAQRAQELGLASLGALSDINQYLPDADFVVVAVPQTSETTGLIGTDQFALMKSTAYIVNVARGPVIDEAALYSALRSQRIAGAGIDVWYKYPVGNEATLAANLPFHELDNVIMTPHNSGYSDGTMRYRWGFIAENLRRLVAGEPLDNVVWPK